jgi:hypothetical protein
VLYVMRSPSRKRARLAAEALATPVSSATQPDGSDHATGEAVTAERKEP